jgi:hypothetical protein
VPNEKKIVKNHKANNHTQQIKSSKSQHWQGKKKESSKELKQTLTLSVTRFRLDVGQSCWWVLGLRFCNFFGFPILGLKMDFQTTWISNLGFHLVPNYWMWFCVRYMDPNFYSTILTHLANTRPTLEHTTPIIPFWGHPVRWTPILKSLEHVSTFPYMEVNKGIITQHKKMSCPCTIYPWWCVNSMQVHSHFSL